MSIKNIIQTLKRVFQGASQNTSVSGTIKFFDRKKRFGFIVAGTQEYFFHAAATRPADFKLLQDGVAVKFNIIQGKKGPQADKVEIVQA